MFILRGLGAIDHNNIVFGNTMKTWFIKFLDLLCFLQGSQYVSHPSGAYDLFASAAAGDCIKLWDLRTNRSVNMGL